MVKKHKKQHFVPVSYLKPWCDPQTPRGQAPYVWVFDRDGSNSRRKAPENILHETDMYTIEVPGKKGRNLVLEHGLSELENRFTKIRNSKLNYGRSLDPEEHILLCAFMAAAHARTRASREHQKKMWERPRRMMEDMMERMKTATVEQKKRMASMAPPRSVDSRGTLDYEQVKALHENPLQHLLLPMISAETPLLSKLDMAVFETDDQIGFITSDYPCVWSDPEWHKRPPLYQGPALMYESIEITLPVSPQRCVFLNRQGVTGYIAATEEIVDSINRTTRFGADKEFIVRTNRTKPIWFDPGVEPEDSWAKTHAKEIEEAKRARGERA